MTIKQFVQEIARRRHIYNVYSLNSTHKSITTRIWPFIYILAFTTVHNITHENAIRNEINYNISRVKVSRKYSILRNDCIVIEHLWPNYTRRLHPPNIHTMFDIFPLMTFHSEHKTWYFYDKCWTIPAHL